MGQLLGWIRPEDRTQEQHDAHAAAESTMPQFAAPDVANEVFEATGKFLITDIWHHADVVKAIGFVFPRFHQLTGSCVGAGGGNVLFSLIAGDAILRGEAEEIFVPFWPYDYGLSRMLGGWNTPGDGSLGSLFAKAVRDDGVIKAGQPGLPIFANSDGLTLHDESTEYKWSVGKNVSQELLALGKAHPVKTTAPIKTIEGLKSAILNKYPVTFACDLNIKWNTDKVHEDCVTGTLDNDGGHQTSIQGVWDHPKLGLLFLNQGNWPASSYHHDPAGGPPCSVWQPADDVQKALDRYHAEVYAFSGFEGFPTQEVKLNWLDA